MWIALVSTELLSVLAMVTLLFGVPAFVVVVLAVLSGYIRYDAKQRLAELEDEQPSVPADEDR
ncbi:hypothetical protein [Natronococcus occultus]|uniref:Uncharacterized protein n=1 Tax=Natronococcus occultus SP4 TaxID=694430 RepID=L0K2M4_9EURY|nr:hypothetical protein [Natronococcus occultus]AGB38343.1 hypothetical protein Natoc_2579 [Natronococcus occultus SP4]